MDNVALPLVYAAIGKPERLKPRTGAAGQDGTWQVRQTHFPMKSRAGSNSARRHCSRFDQSSSLDTGRRANRESEIRRQAYEIMKLFNELNEKERITIVLVTHESDIAAHAKRLVQFLDGSVVYDGAVKDRLLERA